MQLLEIVTVVSNFWYAVGVYAIIALGSVWYLSIIFAHKTILKGYWGLGLSLLLATIWPLSVPVLWNWAIRRNRRERQS